MANLNKVMLIGRLTRDPELRDFSNGGRVAQVGFAVNNRRKNQQTGQWEEAPVWLDLKAFNSQFRKQADLIEKYLKKGSQAYVEGHLVLEEWASKEGGEKRSKLVIYVDEIEFLGARGEVGEVPEGAPAPKARKKEPTKISVDEVEGSSGGVDEVPF